MLLLKPSRCPLQPLAARKSPPSAKGNILVNPFIHEPQPLEHSEAESSEMSLFDAWNASRLSATTTEDEKNESLFIQPGARRKCTIRNISLAFALLQATFLDMLLLLWGLNPLRTTVLICLTIVRGLLPAFRGYSQALILDELQAIITHGDFASSRLGRLVRLVIRECFRMLVESLFDTFANHNENIVHSSMRFYMEQRQLEQRLRLDLPTLSDPTVRDLLHESDLFVRSFTGLGFGFGLFSPLDLVRALSPAAELASQLIVLYSASKVSLFTGLSADPTDKHFGPHLLLLGAVLLPSCLSLITSFLPRFPFSYGNDATDALYSPSEAHEVERAERMRSMAYAEPFRAEVALFGLGPWILDSWSTSRKRILGLETQQNDVFSGLGFWISLRWLLTQTNLSEMLVLLQNLPFFIYSSTTSLGALALYRNSVHSLLFNVRCLVTSFERAFQSVFYMGAFFATMRIEPRLNPQPGREVKYESTGEGMRIEARNISFTYPGSTKPTLKGREDVSFTVEAGETLAIVGYNGSGKTTLSNILLRIYDFADSTSADKPAQLLINNIDIRRIPPVDYHRHVTALFQVFSKLNATVRENVGIGELRSQFRDNAIREAATRAGAGRLINSLPRGLDTRLDCMGLGSNTLGQNPFAGINMENGRQGLSGGEWQRVAISRAFMRARSADLLLLDEPTSHLDARAQSDVLETVETLCRDPVTGRRTKTAIIITHQLSIAKRADKIAMFENGTITEFGTHDELMSRPGSHYASLYRSTVC